MSHEDLDNLRKQRDRLREENQAMREAIGNLVASIVESNGSDALTEVGTHEVETLAAFLDGMKG